MAEAKLNFRPDLSLVIPVFNSSDSIAKTIEQILVLKKYNIKIQIILVDDCSTDNSLAIIKPYKLNYDEIQVIKLDENVGAGLARNVGWNYVKGRYTLFLDIDDNLHPEKISLALKKLDEYPDIDLAFFGYRYHQDKDKSFTGMSYEDEKIFYNVLNNKDFVIGDKTKFSSLLHFTNFPWNKILRTISFVNTEFRFGSSRVHNDIFAHWFLILCSNKIIVFDDYICTHVVYKDGNNLTNQFGEVRLEVFDALNETYDFLESAPELRRTYSYYFWSLVDKLVKWIIPKLSHNHRLSFNLLHTKLLCRIRIEDFVKLKYTNYNLFVSIQNNLLCKKIKS